MKLQIHHAVLTEKALIPVHWSTHVVIELNYLVWNDGLHGDEILNYSRHSSAA